MAKRIQAEIIVDSSAAVRGFRQAGAAGKRFQHELTGTEKAAVLASTSTRKLGGTLGKIDLKGLAAGFAGGAGFVAANEAVGLLTETFKSAVEGATSLQKSGEAIDATYGSSAESVKAFAEHASKFGVSAQQSEALSARIGILARNLGIGQGKAAQMTMGLQSLAGSIAMIRGIDPSTVMQKLPLVLAGNLRSLKELGFSFTTTQIKAEAFREGILKQNQTMTPGIKAQAVFGLLIKQIGFYQAQAGLHADDLSNKQRRLSAEWSNMKDQLGAGLIPILAGFTGGLLATVEAMKKLGNVKLPSWLGDGKLWDRIKDPFGLHKTTHKLLGHDGKKKKPPGKPAPAFTQAIMDIRAEYQTGSPLSGYVVPAPPMAKAELPRSLQIAAMKAQLTKSQADDLKVAQAEEAFFRQQLELADKGSKKYKTILSNLVGAHQSVESITSDMQSQQDAHAQKIKDAMDAKAEKSKAAAAKIKEAAQKAAAAAKAAAEAAKQALQAAVEQEKSAFGELFQGPVLAPTEDQTKAALGVPGVSAESLIADLVAQNKAYAALQSNFAKLRKEGAPKGLIDTLKGQGVAAAANVATIAGMTPALRAKYFAAYKTGQKEIQGAARMDVQAQRVHISAGRVNISGAAAAGHGGKPADTVVHHTHVHLDGHTVAKVVTKHQRRNQKNGASQFTGRNPGHR